jgi:hypothetical protein
MKLFKGQIDASLIIPVLIGLLYAGTGGWSAERWNGALAIMGLGAAARGGYERGYHTYNPELRPQRMPTGASCAPPTTTTSDDYYRRSHHW